MQEYRKKRAKLTIPNDQKERRLLLELEFDIDDLGDSLVKIEWNHVQKTVIFLNLGREKKIYSVIENIKGENLDKFPIIIQLSS